MSQLTQRSNERRAMAVGAVTVAVAVAAAYFTTIVERGLPTQDHTVVKAAFDDIGSLKKGSEVRQNSSRIGRVDDVTLSGGQAIVTLRLDGDRPVYRNARATVADTSALASKFVDLVPGDASAGELDHAVLPASRTQSSVDLDQVLNTFDDKTRDATGRTLRELGGGLAGRSQDLHDVIGAAPDLLADAGTVAATLSSDRTDLAGLLTEAETLAGRFTGRERELAELVENTNDTMAALSVDAGTPLRDTIRKAPGALRAARSALSSLDRPLDDTGAAMTALRGGARSLGKATPNLRAFLRESVDPLRRVPRVAGAAVPAVEDLTSTVADARPLIPSATRALRSASVPLQVLAPYATDIRDWTVNLRSALSDSAGEDFHWLRVGVELPTALTPLGTVEDPTRHRNPYPAPGQSLRDRAGSPISGGGR